MFHIHILIFNNHLNRLYIKWQVYCYFLKCHYYSVTLNELSFSDELEIYSYQHNRTVPVLRTGIAWPSDKEIKFRNPPGDLREGMSAAKEN